MLKLFHPNLFAIQMRQFACRVWHKLKKVREIGNFHELQVILEEEYNTTDMELCKYTTLFRPVKTESPPRHHINPETEMKKVYIDFIKKHLGPTMTAHDGRLKRGVQKISRAANPNN